MYYSLHIIVNVRIFLHFEYYILQPFLIMYESYTGQSNGYWHWHLFLCLITCNKWSFYSIHE